MRSLINKIWITAVLLLNIFSCYSQWNDIYIENFFQSSRKPNICFASPDTGYIIASNYDTKQSYFYITTDSGYNWSPFDTVNNLIIQGIDCRYGFNISHGSYDGNTLLVVFDNNNFINRKIFQFPNYKVISEINVIDSNNAVFSGMNSDSIYELGLITKELDTIRSVTLKTFKSNPIDKIDFFSANEGYYSMQGDLYYMNKTKSTNLKISSNISDYDFFSLDTGIVIKEGEQGAVNIYKTNNSGNDWKYSTYVYIPPNYIEAVMNSNNSLYVLAYWWSSSGADAYINYITLDNNVVDNFRIYLLENPPGGMDLYFYSYEQGYFITHIAQYYMTLNNGGYTLFESSKFVDEPFKIYPNPCNNLLNIEICNAKNYNERVITIINSQGQIIESQLVSFPENHTLVDISNLGCGIYLLNIIEENRTYCKSFIKL